MIYELPTAWTRTGDDKDLGRRHCKQRWADAGLAGTAHDRFLAMGEELSMPMDLLKQRRLEGLWNDWFRERVRAAILGQNSQEEPTFEWTVRQATDCRILGFVRGTQAVNYVTSHDVEGFRWEGLFTMFSGAAEAEKRIKLAFACLLTAVGVPMILAGEEFADQHDGFDESGNVSQEGGKQVDPVNFGRLTNTQDPLQPMRKRVFEYVSRLVKLRTTHHALAVDDTAFIHVDFDGGKRVLAWRRGPAQDPVVVVANFSDWGSDIAQPNAEYVVRNWPATPPGKQWKDVSQDRSVPPRLGRSRAAVSMGGEGLRPSLTEELAATAGNARPWAAAIQPIPRRPRHTSTAMARSFSVRRCSYGRAIRGARSRGPPPPAPLDLDEPTNFRGRLRHVCCARWHALRAARCPVT